MQILRLSRFSFSPLSFLRGAKRFLLVATVAATVSAMLSTAAFAVDAFVEGEHYERLPIPVNTADSDTCEVVEVFSYLCIHCYNFDPAITAWAAVQPDNVKFVRVPAIFSADWESLAQAYYTAEALGVSEQVHMPIFNAIHAQQRDLRRPNLLAKVFADEASVSQEDFDQAYNSFSVRSRVQQAKAKGSAYRITGVPTIIVNGKFRVDGRMAGNNTKMLEVVDYLVAMETETE
jgi:thiol:disulfide interchange protein DsbA